MARPFKKAIRPLGFPVIDLLARLARLVGGLRFARRVGEWIGELQFRLGWRTRRNLEQQLARVLPDTDPATRRGQLHEAYRNSDAGVLEGIAMSSTRLPDALIRDNCEIEGLEALRAELKPDRGVIALSMHMGNSMNAMLRLAVEGFPVSIVYRASRKFPGERVQRLIENHGMQGIPANERSQAYRAMLRALQQGRILFVLMDQGTKFGGLPVEFLGKRLELPEGPFRLAARTGAPVMTVFASAARPRWRYSVGGPLVFGDSSAEAAAKVVAAAMEAQIRAHPGLWSWHHRRWARYPFLDAVAGG